MHNPYKLLVLLPLWLTLSCVSKNSVNEIYKNRAKILKEFQHKSIIKRGENFIALSFHKNGFTNTFYFEKSHDGFVLTNDTLQFPVNEIAALINIGPEDSISIRNAVANELKRISGLMVEYKIEGIKSEYGDVDMKLYLKNYYALLYVRSFDSVKNAYWKNYILSGKQLDSNWYYVKDQLAK